MNSTETLAYLESGNNAFVEYGRRRADISPERRQSLAANGQKPYATIVTCSDSRVPPEHVFCAGLGELFVVRTAGNVIGAFELASVEYGAAHLGTNVVVVMGHSGCGAVAAALTHDGHAHGALAELVDDVRRSINGETDATRAENANIAANLKRVTDDPVIAELVSAGSLRVIGAKYDLDTGRVTWL